ncbi:MAG: D-alanyl-D-alanine carboxypeptidase family protein [Parcubacteria group bacterium]|jgi:D-alanyl-D-alanine carboxypeptidase
MQVIAAIIYAVFLPVNLYFYWPFLDQAQLKNDQPQIGSVQGAEISTEKQLPESLKNSIASDSDNFQNSQDGYGGSGLIPQKKSTFYNTKIFAGSSVAIDVNTGTILYYDDGRTKTPIASLTKVMTATMILEKVKDLNEVVTIDEEALAAEGTKVGCPTTGYCIDEKLHLGEKITVGDLLKAMLMDSANDAAIALGKHVAGSQKAFAALMNEKAKELTLKDSHFCNPSGLDEDGCYSSAYDIARITAYSMRYDRIWSIMDTKEDTVHSIDGKYTHILKSTDVILDEVPNCLGGKTGFTYNAGKSLMLASADPTSGKHKIVAVILNDNERWADMKNLIAWTFENYEWK